MYNVDGTINSVAKDNENNDVSIQRLKTILNYSQVSNVEGGKTFLSIDTIHFSSRLSNSIDLARKAKELVTPVPVNYKNVYASGWVE